MKYNERNSSFELLRLIAMFSIVVYHQFLFLKAQGHEEPWILGGYTVSHFGVPIFLLITGYFGLKLKTQKVVHLYLYSQFWWIITFLCGFFIFGTATIVGGGKFLVVSSLLQNQQDNGSCFHTLS